MTLKTANDGSNGSFNERHAGMNWLKTFLKALLIAVTALQITACSKTVQWEEEVPLNTGETIWVKQTIKYTLQGDAGNPFDMAYRPKDNSSVTEFNWRGKTYRFDLDIGIVLIAISPQGYPVLVGEGDRWNIYGKYPCTTPLYIQFIPDGTGKNWTYPPQIEPWLYNLETNQLFAIPTPNQPKERYTVEERKAANASGISGSSSRQKINPLHTGDICKFKGK